MSGLQHLVDFFHDRAQDLIELQRGGERLAEFVEDGDFVAFAGISGGATGIAAALHSFERLGVSGSARGLGRRSRLQRRWGSGGNIGIIVNRFHSTATAIANDCRNANGKLRRSAFPHAALTLLLADAYIFLWLGLCGCLQLLSANT